MPTAQELAEMYGPDYASSGDPADLPGVRSPERLMQILDAERGVFLDYGCGSGEVLVLARNRGWECYGVELDRDVADMTARETGIPVIARDDIGVTRWPRADTVHLGDVLEHWVDPRSEMELVLQLAKPGARIVAQGPLENNGNLFSWGLRLKNRAFSGAAVKMPPYHVILATSAGQQQFFARMNLKCLEYVLEEVAWPAPARLRRATVRSPRLVTLYFIRRASQLVSAIRPTKWGNRYFYVGRWPGQPAR